MTRLTTKARNKLPASAFAIPPDRYPIHDLSHARNALARVAANGTPEEKRKVARAVARRYGIGPAAKKNRGKATELSAVELANGKPPYQWKHGWIPLTPDAKLIKAKKKRGTAKDGTRKPVTIRQVPTARAQKRPRRIAPSGAQSRNWDSLATFRRGQQGKSEHEGRQQLLAEYTRLHKRQAEKVRLSPDESGAIDDYVYDSDPVNRAMRGEREPNAKEREQIGSISRAIGRAKLEQDTVLYRGTDSRLLDYLKVGDTFSDRAITSTSYDPVIALEFAEGLDYVEGRKPALLVIEAPSGTNALMLDNLNYWQRETLLGSEQEFEVLEISDGMIRVKAK